MNKVITHVGLPEALEAEGFELPEACREVRLIMGIDEAFMLQFDVFLTPENMAKLGRALQKLAERQAP